MLGKPHRRRLTTYSPCQSLSRCPGFKKYRSELQQEKNSVSKGKEDPPAKVETSTSKDPEVPSGGSALLAESSAAAVVSLGTAEPGLVNPAFEETEEGESLIQKYNYVITFYHIKMRSLFQAIPFVKCHKHAWISSVLFCH